MKIRIEVEGDPFKLDPMFRDIECAHPEGDRWVMMPERPGDVDEVLSAIIAALLPPVSA